MLSPVSTHAVLHLGELQMQGWTLVPEQRDREAVLTMLSAVGELTPQPNGQFEYDVKSTGEFQHLRFTKSTQEIGPHTDGSNFANPPRYLALWGRHQATCGGGGTWLSDAYSILQQFNPVELAHLLELKILFQSRPRIAGEVTRSLVAPLVTLRKNGMPPLVRFSANQFLHGDLNGAMDETPDDQTRLDDISFPLIQRMMDLAPALGTRLMIPRDSLLIWDNQRMLHWREAFKDPNRHLIRYFLNNFAH